MFNLTGNNTKNVAYDNIFVRNANKIVKKDHQLHYNTNSTNHMEYFGPINLSYLWNFGVFALVSLVMQLVTGILLAMHYVPNVDIGCKISDIFPQNYIRVGFKIIDIEDKQSYYNYNLFLLFLFGLIFSMFLSTRRPKELFGHRIPWFVPLRSPTNAYKFHPSSPHYPSSLGYNGLPHMIFVNDEVEKGSVIQNIVVGTTDAFCALKDSSVTAVVKLDDKGFFKNKPQYGAIKRGKIAANDLEKATKIGTLSEKADAVLTEYLTANGGFFKPSDKKSNNDIL